MRIQFAAALLLTGSAYAALTITSPAINQCKDAKFTIAGAVGDVQLTILPSDNPCEHDGLVVKAGFHNGEATLSNINIPAGTSVVVVADDAANGNEVWSSTIVVGGSAADCDASSGGASSGGASPVSTIRSSTSQRPSGTSAPVNAAGSTDVPTSGAASLNTSFGFGAVVALAALVFNA